MDDKILAKELEKWFVNRQFDKNKWNRNPVGLVLIAHLQRTGNWKNSPRGNPSKGFEVMNRNKFSDRD